MDKIYLLGYSKTYKEDIFTELYLTEINEETVRMAILKLDTSFEKLLSVHIDKNENVITFKYKEYNGDIDTDELHLIKIPHLKLNSNDDQQIAEMGISDYAKMLDETE